MQKKQVYDNLVNQRDQAQTDLTNKTQDVNNASTALDPLRKNGSSDQYITFFDMLRNLDWSSNKTDSELATNLKSEVDNKFNNVFSNFNQGDYENIVSLYKRREGQISGSRQRLLNELNNDINSLRNSSNVNKGIFDGKSEITISSIVDAYYNNKNNNLNYIPEFAFNSNLFMLNKPTYTYDIDEYNDKVQKYGEDVAKLLHLTRNPGLSTLSNDKYFSLGGIDVERIDAPMSYNIKNLAPEIKNTILLITKSQLKAKENGVFNALINSQKYNRFQSSDYGLDYVSHDAYIRPDQSGLDRDFIKKYNQSAYMNYSMVDNIRFGFKSTNGNDPLHPWAADGGLLSVLEKLNQNDTELGSFLDSRDIEIFKNDYDQLKKYKEKIDWNFNASAIDLNDYNSKLTKVIAYYEKVNNIVALYEEIIKERQNPNGGNQTELDEKSRRLLGLKRDVFGELNDISNFMAGIELVYTDKAREYLEYGKTEADRMIRELNEELRLYDPNEGVIKAVDDKIEALKAEYENAKQAKKNAEDALADLNNQVNANELTPEEKAIDQTISDKEREKQALKEEKARLEKEKQDAQDRLDAARDALSKSNIANLGKNSYAHGFKAFASGDNSIAIGTQALAKGEDSIAMGHESQANAQDSVAIGRGSIVTDAATNGVAIGQGAVVQHEDSVAIGKGSRTEVGALTPNYKAPLGDDREASFESGSIGEFSVGYDGGLRQITHVAAGVNDTDAVNVWQLKEAIARIPRADNNNTGGQPAQPSQPAQPVNVQVYDVSGNNETPVTSLETAINRMNEQGIKYVHVNGATQGTEPQDRSNGDSSASGVYAVSIGHLANAVGDNSVALGDKAESRVDNSVALGADSQTTKEKTENTLGVGNQRDRDIIDNLNNTVNNYAGNAVGVVSVGQKGKERIIQNVAAGLVGANSTDAVNGSQLHALAQAVGRGETGLVRQSTDAANVQNGVNHNRLTVGSATGGSEVNFANVGGQARRLTGVAEGIEATDAVNKSQLDKAIGQLSSRFEKTEKQLKGGISNVAAMASLPQAYLPSQGMLSVATGYYRGSSSVAVGLSQVSDNGRVVFKLNGSASQKGDFTAGAGIGFAW